jgi:carboxypeptidase PM20D1
MIWKSALGGVGLAALALVAVILFNTMNVKSPLAVNAPASVTIAFDETAAAHRLAQAVRFRTVSVGRNQPVAEAAFRGLHDYLAASFPRVHTTLKRETVNGYSLLYTWQGNDSSLKPILVSAHMDVVPVVPGTEEDWTYPPFAGQVADSFVWGRGTMDMKASLVGSLEAIEYLIEKGFTPNRTVYLAFGHDEEIGGIQGAGKIADTLEQRGVKLAFTLDEGLVVTEGILPGINRPVAVVGTAERGFVNLKVTANGPGGHSSMPPSSSAAGNLARALTLLEANPMPAALRPPVTDMFDHIIAEMNFPTRLVFANRWLLEPVILRKLAEKPSTNALIRSTTAITVVAGGVKPNVIPQTADATINVRLLPGDTTASVIDHLRRVIDDPGITIAISPGSKPEASPVSDTSSDGYRALVSATRQVFPDALVAPGLLVGSTDSPHYLNLTDNSFRFLPLRMTSDDVPRFHGTNERIAIDNYADIIRFYVRLLCNDGVPEAARC